MTLASCQASWRVASLVTVMTPVDGLRFGHGEFFETPKLQQWPADGGNEGKSSKKIKFQPPAQLFRLSNAPSCRTCRTVTLGNPKICNNGRQSVEMRGNRRKNKISAPGYAVPIDRRSLMPGLSNGEPEGTLKLQLWPPVGGNERKSSGIIKFQPPALLFPLSNAPLMPGLSNGEPEGTLKLQQWPTVGGNERKSSEKIKFQPRLSCSHRPTLPSCRACRTMSLEKPKIPTMVGSRRN